MPGQTDKPADSEEGRLVEWQQGDFSLECGDFLFRDCAEEEEAGEDPSEIVLDSSVEGFAVISQTCEIVRDAEQVPYVTVCPLIQIDDAHVQNIEKGQAPRYGILPGAPNGLFVDFSRTMSVSKSLLTTWKRHRGCLDDKDLVRLAKSIEIFFGRFAFPDDFVACVSKFRRSIVGKYGKEQSNFGKAVRSIRELRVLPSPSWIGGDQISIMFIVILEVESDRELKSVEEIRDEIEPKLREIEWTPAYIWGDPDVYFTTLGDISAAEYLNTYPLDVNALSFAKRYS